MHMQERTNGARQTSWPAPWREHDALAFGPGPLIWSTGRARRLCRARSTSNSQHPEHPSNGAPRRVGGARECSIRRTPPVLPIRIIRLVRLNAAAPGDSRRPLNLWPAPSNAAFRAGLIAGAATGHRPGGDYRPVPKRTFGARMTRGASCWRPSAHDTSLHNEASDGIAPADYAAAITTQGIHRHHPCRTPSRLCLPQRS